MTDDWTQTWRAAEVVANREVGRGTRRLTLHLPDDLPFPFEPGHVVALRDRGLRHAYTVCLPDAEARTLGLVFRVIPGGRLTPGLEAAAPGYRVEVSGLHHSPVRSGVAPAAAMVVGLSTGSGVGPLWGFAERALAEGFDRPIRILAGWREEADICLGPDLDALQARHPGFTWRPTLTGAGPAWPGLRGRVGAVAPLLAPEPRSCHFHLVGNGRMVADLKAALAVLGVEQGQVSTETFFNHGAEADPEAVREIVEAWGRG